MNNFINFVQIKNSNYDLLGASSSTLCMIHCLITPILFTAHATCSSTCSEISPFWWKIIDCVFLIISFLAIQQSAKTTTLKYIQTLMYSAWAFLAIIILNNMINLFNINHALIYLPALSLAGFHLYNRKYCACKEEKCCVA